MERGAAIKNYRNEWKYQCNEAELIKIESLVQNVLERDENSTGPYTIHSLYFDDVFDSCARDTSDGLFKRFKYRIRYYADMPDKLFLERKEKLEGRCHKKRCLITGQEYDRILAGDVSDIMWETDKELLKQFCVHYLKRGFAPKVIICYERSAYAEPITNVRITFDRNISASDEFDRFRNGDYLRTPILPKGQNLLEVKFDYILNSTYRRLISDESLVQSSFSKYYLGRRTINKKER